jgi:ferredoxin-NADP reductase
VAGQHVDVRLTAEDGYQASRSYSLAAPADGDRLEITVQRLSDGEVSPFLTDGLAVGDPVEARGPFGGWFVWRPDDSGPVLLVAGGSGIVPLMAMIRARAGVSRAPFRLVYSVRTPDDRIYASELRRRVAEDGGLDVAWVHTRIAPDGDPRPPGRLRAEDLTAHGWPPDFEPTCYVCGPTGFVEAAATLLTGAGHDPARIRTERFGGA